MDELMEALLGGGGAIAGGLLTKDAYDKLGSIGDTAITEMTDLGQQGLEQTAFKPYSVTSTTGSQFGVSPEGSINMMLSPEERAQQQMLMGQATNMFSQAAAPMAETEENVFNRLMALQNPAMERCLLYTSDAADE